MQKIGRYLFCKSNRARSNLKMLVQIFLIARYFSEQMHLCCGCFSLLPTLQFQYLIIKINGCHFFKFLINTMTTSPILNALRTESFSVVGFKPCPMINYHAVATQQQFNLISYMVLKTAESKPSFFYLGFMPLERKAFSR